MACTTRQESGHVPTTAVQAAIVDPPRSLALLVEGCDSSRLPGAAGRPGGLGSISAPPDGW